MVTASPVRIDRGRVAELTEREQKKLDARTTRSGEMYERARRTLSGGVASSYQVREPWPIYLEKRPRFKGLGRGRHRDGRFPQWVRVDGAGARQPGHRRGRAAASRSWHSLCGASRRRYRRQRGTGAPLRSPAVALRQLRFRGDDGRYPHRPRLHRTRHDRQDLRFLPRPPRLCDGLDLRPLREHRRPRQLRVAAIRRRNPKGRLRPDDRGAVQRRWRHGAPHRTTLRGGPAASLRDHGSRP